RLGMVRTLADEPYAAETSIEALDAARIGNTTFDQAVAQFEKLEREKATSAIQPRNPDSQANGEESRLFIALSAILREKSETIGRSIAKIGAGCPASDRLIAALSSASTPAAESALVDLANAKTTSSALREKVLVALARTPRPAAKAIDALMAIQRDDPFNEQAL